jgi:hypothetical protein
VWGAVILAALGLMLVQFVTAQSAARKGPPKGPRALGLLQLSPNGKGHLIPIVILYDGEFYDASAYKAAPVPMALESGTVYEAFRSGVSEGLFTVSSALHGNNTWIGDGTWQSASAIAATKAAAAKRKEALEKPTPEPVEGPPVLRRAHPAKSTPPAPSTPPATPSPTATAPPPTPPATSAPTATPAPTTTPAPGATQASGAPAPPATAAAPPASTDEDDPDRPVLKRGVPSPAEKKKAPATLAKADAKKTGPSVPAATSSAPAGAGPASSVQSVPAISDANGPEPRPYIDDIKPDEETKLRQKILAMAADEVRARAAQLAAEAVGSPAPHPVRPSAKAGAHAKLPQPTFEDVQLRIFDLSNSNEPVLVLTAKARMPARPNAGASALTADLQYLLTLVARDDIYDELHKAFVNITDSQHMDVLPRMELIDAVDADGDGRGELLFRQISDAGKAFVLYRVIGDQLWPLFQGTPGP